MVVSAVAAGLLVGQEVQVAQVVVWVVMEGLLADEVVHLLLVQEEGAGPKA